MSVCSIHKLTHGATVLVAVGDKLSDWLTFDGEQMVDTVPLLRGGSVRNFPRQNESHVIEFELEHDLTDAAEAADAMLNHPLDLPRTEDALKWEIDSITAHHYLFQNATIQAWPVSNDHKHYRLGVRILTGAYTKVLTP